MSVSNGQPGNATTLNNAFMSRTGDTSTSGNATVGGNIKRSVQTGITAFAGGGQGSATALTKDLSFISTVASSGDSVKLPASSAGLILHVFNQGANAADLFPFLGEQIDDLAANTAISIPAGEVRELRCRATGFWYSDSPAATPVDLTTDVTGVLPVANGGTSLATLTQNNVMLGNGASAPLFVAPGTSGNLLTSNGTTWQSTAPSGSVAAPTVQKFTSGSGTYTRPTAPTPSYLRVTIIGGGGGGSDAANNAGSNGVDSTFDTITATKGFGSTGTQSPGNGSTGSTLGGYPGYIQEGSGGHCGMSNSAGRAFGGHGGDSSLGHGGRGPYSESTTVSGGAANANSGGGGAGGVNGGSANAAQGMGGGAAGTVQAIITSPASSYSYAIGAGGAGATNGGAGGSGLIVVEEYY